MQYTVPTWNVNVFAEKKEYANTALNEVDVTQRQKTYSRLPANEFKDSLKLVNN